MNKIVQFLKRTAVTALGVSMLFQGLASAAPKDELEEILERQGELNEEKISLLEQNLDFSGLCEAAGENGLQMQLSADLKADGQAGSLDLNLQFEKELQRWLVGLGVDFQEEDVLDASLYGDSSLLALAVPQFFSGELAVRSGSLREQVSGSALMEMFGLTDDTQIPDVTLTFVPDESADDPISGGIEEEIEKKAEELQESMQVEKTEEGDVAVYTACVSTEGIIDLYRIVLDSYLSLAEELGISVTVNGSQDARPEFEGLFARIQKMLGDEILLDYRVRDGLVEGINYEFQVDPAIFEQDSAVLEDGVEVDADSSGSGPVCYLVDLTFADPEDPVHGGFTVDMTMSNEARTTTALIELIFDCTNDGSSETHEYTLRLAEPETQDSPENEIYSGVVYKSVFDSSTGEYDVDVKLPKDETGSGAFIELQLDSVFSEVEKGMSFVWTLEDLTVSGMDEAGNMEDVSGELRISADPGDIAEPQDPHMIFEMDETELSQALMEIAVNAQTWMNAMNGEEETESTAVPAETELVME